MYSAKSSTTGKPKTTPFGKVMGIVESLEQLQKISDSLRGFGVQQIEVMGGNRGRNKLDEERDELTDGWGDMEEKEVKKYLDAVKRGLIVFAATVEPEISSQVANAAKALGATEIVHFGSLVITNY